ncbi:MAG: WecB/TagA/CpsF family glycosyltransferase [Actinomycetes bacterium]
MSTHSANQERASSGHRQTRTLFGFECHAATSNQAAADAVEAIETGSLQRITFLNAAKVTDTSVDYRALLNSSERLYADGQSILVASRILRQPLPERVAGVDLFQALISLADERHWRVAFLGSTDEVLAETRRIMAARFPGAEVVGSWNGYFDRSLDDEVVAEIAQTRPQLLFVAMPSPLKEQWVTARGSQTGAEVVMAIGGSLEVFTGQVKRAPRWFQQAGLEWAWRVGQEPRRLWRRYLSSNLKFIGMLLREAISGWRAP